MSQKGFGVIYILVGVLILSFVAGGAYYLGKSSEPKPSTPMVSQTPQPTPSPTPDASPAPTGAGETANWKTYTNTEFRYLLKYPQSWVIKNEDETTPTLTVTTIISNDIETYTEKYGIAIEQVKKGVRLTIRVEQNDNFNSYEELKNFMENKATTFPRDYFKNQRETKIDGVNAMVKTNGEGPTGNTYSYFIKDNIVYEIVGTSPENIDILFNLILSTFKFTN